MDKLTALLLLALPVATLAGVFVGAYLTHRSHTHQSPMPDVVGSVKGLISVFRKPAPTKNYRTPMPPMRA